MNLLSPLISNDQLKKALMLPVCDLFIFHRSHFQWEHPLPPHHQPIHTPVYTSQRTLLQGALTKVKLALKYLATEVAWSGSVFIGILQPAVCLYDSLSLPRLHVATCHFDPEGDTTP